MCAFLVLLFTAYEKGHQRPALSVYTFQMPESCHSQPCSPSGVSSCGDTTPVVSPQAVYASSMMDSISTTTCSPYARPPLPQRGSSLERPHIPGKMANISCNGGARESFHNSGEFAEISHLIEIKIQKRIARINGKYSNGHLIGRFQKSSPRYISHYTWKYK